MRKPHGKFEGIEHTDDYKGAGPYVTSLGERKKRIKEDKDDQYFIDVCCDYFEDLVGDLDIEDKIKLGKLVDSMGLEKFIELEESKRDASYEKLVKTLKKRKDVDNPWALAHYIQDKNEDVSDFSVEIWDAEGNKCLIKVGAADVEHAKEILKTAAERLIANDSELKMIGSILHQGKEIEKLSHEQVVGLDPIKTEPPIAESFDRELKTLSEAVVKMDGLLGEDVFKTTVSDLEDMVGGLSNHAMMNLFDDYKSSQEDGIKSGMYKIIQADPKKWVISYFGEEYKGQALKSLLSKLVGEYKRQLDGEKSAIESKMNEDKNWTEESIVDELAQTFGEEYKEEIKGSLKFPGGRYESFTNETGSFEADGDEYNFFTSDEVSEEVAFDVVKDMLDSEPELFSASFLEKHMFIDDVYRRQIALDDADSVRSDLEYDLKKDDFEAVFDRIELGKEAYEDLQEKLDNATGVKAAKLIEQIKALAEKNITEYCDELADSTEEALKDPVQCFVKDQGIYTIEELMKAQFMSLNTKEAAADAIETDGVGHFLSHYDGEMHDTANGLVYFRE